MSKKQIISTAIKERLTSLGLKKKDFAELMDVQCSIVTRWLSGKHNFTVSTIYKIETKLGIQIIDLK